jgi:hypothetical protein
VNIHSYAQLNEHASSQIRARVQEDLEAGSMAPIVVLDDGDALRYVSGLGRLLWAATPVAEITCRERIRELLRNRLQNDINRRSRGRISSSGIITAAVH